MRGSSSKAQQYGGERTLLYKKESGYSIMIISKPLDSFGVVYNTGSLTCADPEVRHSNTEESVLYFIRRKHNVF